MSIDCKKIILFLIILISTNFFQFIPIYNSGIISYSKNILIVLLIGLFFYGSKRHQDYIYFRKEIILLMVLPFLSSITSKIYRGQSFIESFLATKATISWLLFFVLIRLKYTNKIVLSIILKIAIIVAGIFILQQIFYPSFYYFNDVSNDIEDIEVRNGFFRFRLFLIIPYVYIAFYYYIDRYLQFKQKKNLLRALLFLIPIYLLLTRQIWFCIFIPLLYYIFIYGKRFSFKRLFMITCLCFIVYFIYSNLDLLVGKDLIERTANENSEDNIRIIAMNFFGLEYWQDWFNVLLGNGCPYLGSKYGIYIENLKYTSGLYMSDIGIVGIFSQYGLFYVLALLLLYIKTIKYFRYLSKYLKMLIFASLLNLPLACWFDTPIYMSIIYFLINQEININKNKINAL